jgi:methyl-accepting chemotaxis protein
MTPTDTTSEPAAAQAAARPGWVPSLQWAGVLLCVGLAWIGGVAGLCGALLAATGAAWIGLSGPLARRPTLAAGPSDETPAATAPPVKTASSREASPAAPQAGRHGSEVMVTQVVPVWSRQLEVTRDAANDGLTQLLGNFSEISGALNTLTNNLETFSVGAEAGAVDHAVRTESPALEKLTAASQRAFEQRDAAMAEMGRCVTGLTELQQLAKQSREIARHARLVAFNASIEANRTRTQNDGGAEAVATELRMLAAQMASTGEQIERVVSGLNGTIRKARCQGELADTSPEELRLEIDLCARQALATLLASLGASVQGSSEVRQASSLLREQIDQVFINFQFGDRVSQMMSIIANDMTQFAQWLAANPRATQTDAAEWLEALEASYTMDEQRSHHHGNVHIERSSAVEFF